MLRRLIARLARWKKLALAFAIFLFVVAGAAALLLGTQAGQQLLLKGAQRIAAGAGHPFTARRFELRLFGLGADLSGFVYDNAGIRVEADELKVRVPRNFYREEGIVLDVLEATGLRIAVTSAEPAIPEPSGEPAGRVPRVSVGRISIRNGSFSYANQAMRVDVPSFSLETSSGQGALRLSAPVSISPETVVNVPEIPLQLSPTGILYGPIQWSGVYSKRQVSGSASGRLDWSPAIAVDAAFATDPVTIEKWDGIVASGIVRYEDGKLHVDNFRATRRQGELTASATISDQDKTAVLAWNAMRLDPAGLAGVTDGQLDLNWKLSDFTDISGKGHVAITTTEYGTARSDVEIVEGRARLNVQGTSHGVKVGAVVRTGFDRSLSGTFNASYPLYGDVTARGTLAGTLTSPRVVAKVEASGVKYQGFGPFSGTADASYRNNVVDVSALMLRMGKSVVRNADLHLDLNKRTIAGSIPEIIAELDDFVPRSSGQILSSATISGSLDHPTASFMASSAGLDVEGTHIDSVNAVATLAEDLLQVAQLTARQKDGMLDASGTVNLKTEQVDADGAISNFQITQVRDLSATVNLEASVSGTYRQPVARAKGELINIVYAGKEHGTLTIEGTTTRDSAEIQVGSEKYKATAEGTVTLIAPYAFTATASLNETPVDYEAYHFIASGGVHGVGTLSPAALSSAGVESLSVTGEGVDLKADGSLDTGVMVDMRATLAELPVENIELTGDAQIDAVVRGTIDSPRIDGYLETTNTTIRTAAMTQPAVVETAVDFTRDRFTIRAMTATYEDARVTVNGNGTLKGTGEFTFKAENIRPERFLVDRPITGLIGVSGDLRVNAPRLDAIEGQATVNQLELLVQGIEVHQTGQGQIRLQNQVASLENFQLEGPETRASAAGTVGLATGDLSVDVNANTDLRILEGFLPRTTVFGRVESQVVVRGNTRQPDMKGFINVADAEIQRSDPSLYIAGIKARMTLVGNRVQIDSASGNLNGGDFEVSGATGISSRGLENADIEVQLREATLEYPDGLQSAFSADLALTGTSPNAYLVGEVNVLDALYRENIDLRGQLFSRVTPSAQPTLAAPSSSGFADAINLDIDVYTSGPVSVVNNLARMDLFGSFRIRGKVDDPIILGRADAEEGGEVYFGPSEGGEATALGERRDRYIIQRGVVEFNNPLRTEPTLDFEATHDLRVRDERYAIRLTAKGTPADLVTELTSDPFLSEPDIVSMLLTGRTFSDLQGAQVAVARDQFLDYVSGQLTSRFFRGAGTALGLDTVTIEPSTGAAEDDVSARLTVGKQLRNDLSLIYAQNLAGPRNQSWILNYSAVKDFVVRAINRPDQDEVRLEFRHGFELGGGPPLPRRIAPRMEPLLGNVSFSMTALSDAELREIVAKAKSPYSVNRMSEDTEALVNLFAEKGYPDVKIRPTRQANGGVVDVRFNMDQGLKTTFEFRGNNTDVPDEIKKELLRVWIDGRAEATSREEGVAVLLRYFRDEGYLDARVTVTNESQNPTERLYVFHIESGKKYRDPKWVFQGIEPMDVTDSPGTVIAKPDLIQQQIESSLREKGFLDAKVQPPVLDLNNDEPHFIVNVDLGKQYRVGNVNYEGNDTFPDTHLSGVVILGPTVIITSDEVGATRPPPKEKQLLPFPYDAEWLTSARRRILTEYWQFGFNDVQIIPSTHYEPGSGVIDVTFDIKEGEEQKLHHIRVMGDERTLRSHVSRYFKIFSGDPVDYSRISLTRKRLYDTGLFKRVDIQIVKDPEGNVAEIDLNERAPWSVRYGFTVTDRKENDVRDRDLGISTEVTHRNLWGLGITSGLSVKLDTTLREARLFSSFPVFMNREITTTLSLFRAREALPDVVTKTTGFTVKQQRRLRDYYLLSYDYNYRHVGTIEIDKTKDDPEVVDGVVPVARLNGTLTRDTRDDLFDATRGTFFSNSLDFAPPGIGSSVRYVRNYTQYLRFREVRPNLIWASAYRLGLARGFGGSNLVPADRFTAGGPTSLRAFSQDRASLQPGNALFVMNQELRRPLFWKFGVVAFFDVGNVYPGLGSTKVLEQRYSPGLGIRIDTPFVLLRVDLGLNLWPRTGEDKRRISFGIGQAF